MRSAPSFSKRRTIALSLAGTALLISGCGVGTNASTGVGSTGAVIFTGKVIGGQNPITGAAVSFYETSNNGTAHILSRAGYYAPATPLSPLGTVYTDATGGFTFNPALACASSTDYVYATAYGGNSGANAFNPNILLAAAVGTCANFGASTYININEVTTVAAAYALAGFSSTSGSFDSTLSVASSATNYATASATTPSAAGLAHAFANAANLVNVNAGVANTSLPSNPNAVVPVSIIYALANSVQACVNSLGGSPGDGSPCGNLFTYTTSSYSVSSVVTTVTPQNTFDALLNIVRYPTANVASIYNLGSAKAAFAPAIDAPPATWAIAIAYPKYDGATNGITNSSATDGLFYPIHLALDANDNVYVLNTNASSTAVAPATVQSQSNIVAFSSNGTPLYATPVDTSVNVNPRQVATDAVGNVFMVSDTGVTQFNAASGSVSQNFTLPVTTGLQSIAVDSLNNFFVGVAETITASTQNLYEYTCSSPCSTGSSYSNITFPITPAAGSVAGYTPTQIFIDKSRNVWASNYNSSAVGTPFLLSYKTATSSYSAAEGKGTMGSGTGYNGNYAMVVNNNGNGWVEGATQICKMNGATPSCGYYNDALPGASLRMLAIDGNNVLWGVDNFNGTIHSYQTVTAGGAQFVTLTPCVSTASAACTASSLSGPVAPQVDSTGSIWVTSAGKGGILQFIGAASPTWPVLSYLKPGVMP